MTTSDQSRLHVVHQSEFQGRGYRFPLPPVWSVLAAEACVFHYTYVKHVVKKRRRLYPLEVPSRPRNGGQILNNHRDGFRFRDRITVKAYRALRSPVDFPTII